MKSTFTKQVLWTAAFVLIAGGAGLAHSHFNAKPQAKGPGFAFVPAGSKDSPVSGTQPRWSEPWQENMARGQLWELRNNCRLFWQREGGGAECRIDAITQPPYGFTLQPPEWSADMGSAHVTLISGYAETFAATAKHADSDIVWELDLEGEVRCMNFAQELCERRTHFNREPLVREAREWGGNVDADSRYVVIE